MKPVQLAANPKHGCDACRDMNNRALITADLVRAGRLCTAKTRCATCGAYWNVRLFESHVHGVCVEFLPVQSEPAS